MFRPVWHSNKMLHARREARTAAPEVCSAMIGPGFSSISERPHYLLRPAQRFFPAFLIFSVLVCSGNGFAHAATIGTMTALAGSVALTRPGSDRTNVVKQGDEILVGDELRTGKDSGARLTLTDGSFADLSPGSALRVNQYAFDVEENRRTARVRVLAGRVRFVLYKARSNGSAFYVETNSVRVTAGVFGDFGISVLAGGTEVAVLANSVSVINISDLVIGNISVGVNQKTVVKEKKPPAAPVTLTLEERKSYMQGLRSFRKDR